MLKDAFKFCCRQFSGGEIPELISYWFSTALAVPPVDHKEFLAREKILKNFYNAGSDSYHSLALKGILHLACFLRENPRQKEGVLDYVVSTYRDRPALLNHFPLDHSFKLFERTDRDTKLVAAEYLYILHNHFGTTQGSPFYSLIRLLGVKTVQATNWENFPSRDIVFMDRKLIVPFNEDLIVKSCLGDNCTIPAVGSWKVPAVPKDRHCRGANPNRNIGSQ
ncbi:MAG TPA: hypothetical protein PKD37_03610 [Oligoflexia bacterium]|nr:hypothetical protein [Oligoflexia bacterium]HMP27054.1 hypothetical protein [Oligoflexia bacterium]